MSKNTKYPGDTLRRITIVTGDITRCDVEAIVNAANSSLLGGGGVDGAIHRAAGPELLAECKKLHGCPTGEAKSTKGYRLPASWVIHTVGPRWKDGKSGEKELLHNAYTNSLREALRLGARSLAFPAISTGVYGYPKEEAAHVAVMAIHEFLSENALPRDVYCVCFSEESAESHRKALEAVSRFTASKEN